jgi:FkbM family methyltransferase
MLKRTLRKAAYTLGLHVGKFPATDTLQGHLKYFFQRAGINCVLDVGAHQGEFAGSLQEIGYKGRLVSFEPVKANYEILAGKARAERDWLAHHCALGAEDGEQEINIYQQTVFNSFLSSSEMGTERFGAAVELATKERVRIRRLDQVFRDCIAGIANPRVFLKMDTQGWDMEVLKGASGVLDQIVGMQSEMAVKQIYGGMTGYTAALEHFAKLGFHVTGMFSVSRDTDGLQIVEFECVLVRDGAVTPS